MRSVCKTLFGKPKPGIMPASHRRWWDDNIKMDCKETCYQDVDWSQLAVDMTQWWTFMDVVVILKVPQILKNFLVTWLSHSFFERTMLHWVISVWCRALFFFFYLTTCREKGNVFMQRRFVLSTKSRLPSRRPSVFVFWINSVPFFPGSVYC